MWFSIQAILHRGDKAAINLDFTKELVDGYLGAFEEIDVVNLPKALIDEMEITVFVDLDHAHDKVSRQSIMLIFLAW
jgi:hypothetical protein